MAEKQPPNFLNANPAEVNKQHMINLKSKKPDAPTGPDPQVLEEISALTRRIKLLETSLSNLRGKSQTIENNQVENHRDNRRDIKALEEENDDLNALLSEIKENIKIIIREVKESAKKQEVEVIQKYLDMWNPVHFVTAEQVKKISKDVYEQMQRKPL